MTTRAFLAVIAAVQLAARPAMVQTAADKDNAHHYRGGPKTEVPRSMQHVQSGPNTSSAPDTTNGHH